MNCIHCHKPIPPAEHTAYDSRCEDCWACKPDTVCMLGTWRAGECYSKEPIGDLLMVSNNPHYPMNKRMK